MKIAGLRRTSMSLAVLGLTVFGPSAIASAAPTFMFKLTAVPIPGFPAPVTSSAPAPLSTVKARSPAPKTAALPPPLIGVKFYAPAGTKAASAGVCHLRAERD